MSRDDLERPEKDPMFPGTTRALGADIKNSREVLEADRLRREDDRRTEVRQAVTEEEQHEAERVLQENARRLDEGETTLDGVQARAFRNRNLIDSLREDVESLRSDTQQLAADADRIDAKP
jgi:hypothetical protein